MTSKGLRILHISTARSWRGGEQQIAYLIAELAKKGAQQFVVCIKDAPFHQWCIKNEIPVKGLKKRSSLDLSFAAQLKRFSHKNKAQIWHAHDAHAHGFAVYANAFFKAQTPLVVSRRVDFPVAGSWLSAFKYNHKSVKKILCVSSAIADIVKAKIKNPSVVEVVYSVIDQAKFKTTQKGILRQELAIPANHKIIGNVAALVDHKDHHTFINCAEILNTLHDNISFVIAGDGALRSELEAKVQEKGLSNNFYFLGFRPDVPRLIADFDLFLFTSKTEGLGTSILDAFAAGIPTVATAAGGIPEIVINSSTGLLCPVKDADQLAQAAERVLSDPLLAKKLVQGAYEKLALFSLENLGKRTYEQYQLVLH